MYKATDLLRREDAASLTMLGLLFGIWTWFAFAAVSAVGYVVCLVIFAFTALFDPTRKITGTCIRVVGILMCKAVVVWRFRYLDPLPAKLPEKCVVVSNHCSNLDPFLLGHLPWEMKFLAKSVLFRIPFVGWGIKIAGDIPLVRGSAASVKKAMRKAAWYVNHGMPVVIFPEGTRSRTTEMLPFKDGAFRLAIETQADVLPIAVGGTASALKKGDWKPGFSRGASVVGEPISTQGMTMADLPALRERARDAISELRKRLVAEGYR